LAAARRQHLVRINLSTFDQFAEKGSTTVCMFIPASRKLIDADQWEEMNRLGQKAWPLALGLECRRATRSAISLRYQRRLSGLPLTQVNAGTRVLVLDADTC